jgi:glycosyltransferase involved in cell wall biosynthesis
MNQVKPPACFINPFLNHSYFTVRALGLGSNILLFCPPLQLQFLLGRWNRTNILLVTPPLKARIVNLFCVIVFLCFRLRLVSHPFYISAFRRLLSVYLRQVSTCSVFVFYQDYVADLVERHHPESSRICELIIATQPCEHNYSSTMAAIQSSSVIVFPTPSLSHLVKPSHRRCILAPYGGNKLEYLSSHKLFDHPDLSPSISSGDTACGTTVIRIAARSHSTRKGADVLLNALLHVDSLLANSSSSLLLDIFVCGAIREPSVISLFRMVADSLRRSNRICLQSLQLGHYEFSNLLASSDLFIMPSRLESTSLAALEALWHGVPSIITPACGVDDFINDRHGVLLTEFDPFRLASAIRSLCQSPARLDSYRRYLSQDRPIFTWNRYFDAYSHLISADSSCQ